MNRFGHSREFYIPKNATKMDSYGTDAAVYVYPIASGRVGVVAFQGRAQKPAFNYSYNTADQAASRIKYFVENRKAYADRMAARRAEAKKPHEFTDGDIFVCSWGYDQTNIDFYQVVKTTKRTVTVRKIGKKVVRSETGSDFVVAVPNDFYGDPVRRTVKNGYIKAYDFASASKWNGEPVYQTAFGYGH